MSLFRPRGPLTWLDPGAFGTLGVGGGFALGAKLCRPESEVWVIYGDGSLGYSVAEFDTFTRHKVKLTVIMVTCSPDNSLNNGKVGRINAQLGAMLLGGMRGAHKSNNCLNKNMTKAQMPDVYIWSLMHLPSYQC